MKCARNTIFYLLFALATNSVLANGTLHYQVQADTARSQSINKKRLIGVSVTAGTIYAVGMIGLSQLWYADYPKSSFHFINDCGEWLSMDKIGHVTTSYWVGRIGYESLRWSGVPRKKAIWYGGTWGFVFLSTVEVFDGFSAEWGASMCDVAANTFGTALFIGQQLLWDDQRFTFKFSFHPTDYPQYNPDQLGENLIQQIFKDYNGQTYWLSTNIASFLKKDTWFPRWLDVSIGYSGEGMIGAKSNPAEYDGEPVPYFQRYSQVFLSLDADLTKIRTRNETVRLLLNLIGYIKIPFPTLEFNTVDKVQFHWLYF